ncbi:hypothetical protein [Methylobacterium oryzisoli]|uniref:hypothetical protein n=1 Tax=Methylobacterium oryzisoli TaxID=3385502 RepID=UPI003892229D
MPLELLTRPDQHGAPVRTRPSARPAVQAPDPSERGGCARLPARWVLEGGLRAFRGDAAHLGRSIAALKLLLTLAIRLDHGEAGAASVVLSYEQLSGLSGLSEPSICAGKKVLVEHGLVRTSCDWQGQTLAYGLTGLPTPDGVVPLRYRRTGGRDARMLSLHRIPCRKLGNLNALKIYLLLTALGSHEHGFVPLHVESAATLTAVSPVKVVEALDHLTALGLATPADVHLMDRRQAEYLLVRLQPLW